MGVKNACDSVRSGSRISGQVESETPGKRKPEYSWHFRISSANGSVRPEAVCGVQRSGRSIRDTAGPTDDITERYALGSRFSSLRKRQSVLCAMIFCGVDLISPNSPI